MSIYTTLRFIARFYGVNLKFSKKLVGGRYWNGKIILSSKLKTKDAIDLFFHEVAHYKNDIEGKYPVYHREDENKAIKRMGLNRYSNYALKAEIYTDKVGKQLCKQWFPDHKYKIGYKNSSFNKGFMYGYYFSGGTNG